MVQTGGHGYPLGNNTSVYSESESLECGIVAN